MPPTVPINHYFCPRTNKKDKSPYLLFHAGVFKAVACFKHSNFLKVKFPIYLEYNRKDVDNIIITLVIL